MVSTATSPLSSSTTSTSINTDTTNRSSLSSTSEISSIPENLQHLYNNPHILFPEPPIACFARRDNWNIKTISSSNDFVEITLSLETKPWYNTLGLLSSSSSSSSSSASSITSTPSITPSNDKIDEPLQEKSIETLSLPSVTYFRIKRLIIFTLCTVCLLNIWSPLSSSAELSTINSELLSKGLLYLLYHIIFINTGLLWSILYEIGLRCILGYLISILVIRPQVIQESVAAIRGLGLQITTIYNNGHKETTFIDAYSIRSIIVNEGIRSCNVLYYLAVIASGRRNMLLLYEYSRPRLPVIAYIYSKLIQVLSE